jgi:tryptophan-rich sensory protein
MNYKNLKKIKFINIKLKEMSSVCEKVEISEPFCPTQTYVECAPNNYVNSSFIYGNKALMVYLGVFLVIFLLALIIGFTNSTAQYYSLTLPSWAPSLTTWTFIFALVLFFTAFAASKMQLGSQHKNHWYSLFFVISIVLILFFVFFIFQMNNFRVAFWILVAGAILLIITMFCGWNTYRSASLWLIPLLLLEIFWLVETWQIVSLNNL